jgi:hypothetical protein
MASCAISAHTDLTEHAARVVADWPAPTQEQLQRVAAILLTATPMPSESCIPESGGVSAHAA